MFFNLLGRIVWFVTTRFARYELAHNRARIAAGATALVLLVAGVVAARLARSSGDSA